MAEEDPVIPAQEAMETDGEDEVKTEEELLNGDVEGDDGGNKDEGGEVKEMNGEVPDADDSEPKVNGEDKKDIVRPGHYKVRVSGLPRFYPLGEFKKLVKEELGLALNYVRCPKRGNNPWLHLAFSTTEDQQKALKALHKYSWRRKILSCSLVTNDAQKRKPEDGAGDDSDAKKARLDMTVEERVLMVTIPYHDKPYDEQLKKKKEELKTMVQRLGELVVRQNPELAGWAEQQREKHDGLVFQLEEIRPSPVVDGYRNKCEFRVGLNPDTRERTVGCRLENFKDGSMGVGPAESLKHLPDQMREAVKLFQEYVRKSDKEPYCIETRQGYWRHLIVRVTCSGDVMLVVVAHPQSLTEEELTQLKEDVKDYFLNREGKSCNVSSLYFQKFTENVPNSRLVGVPLPEMEHLYGKTRLQETMLDLAFHLSPTSYFQVNTKGAEVLYSAIMDLVQPNEDTTVLDLCCGTGGIGLCIAKKCGQVIGIEYLTQNINDAKFNAEQNGITNCEFIAGRVEDVLPTLSEKITGKTVVPILDPPRAGLNQKVLSQLRKMANVQKLVYVCSNHKAPIRNFLDLCSPAGKHAMAGHPFVPVRTVPIDVVPHTLHAQMAVLLERVDPAKLPKAEKPLPPAAGRGKMVRGRGRGAKMVMVRGRGRGMAMQPPPLMGRGGRGRPRMPLMPLRGHPPPMHMGPYRPPLPGPPAPMLPPPRREPFREPYHEPFLEPYHEPYCEPFREPYHEPFDGYHDPYPEPFYAAPRRRTVDFSADELTLSRYSDFRRDVEDAIDSSMIPPRRPPLLTRPMPPPAPFHASAPLFGPPPPPRFKAVGGVGGGRGQRGQRGRGSGRGGGGRARGRVRGAR